MASSLPQDVLLFHILPKLPTKSTSRFMCVSKQLYTFLSSDMFKKMHNRHLDRHQNPDKLLVVSDTSPHMFGTFDFEAPDNGLVPSRFRLPFDSKDKRIDFVTSFHGLVCVGIVMDHMTYSDFILWNPLTSDYKTLSKTNSDMHCYNRYWRTSGLFYSSCEDDYKLVRVIHYTVYIYSLKSDSWRRSVASLKANLDLASGSRSLCLSGNLYFKRYRTNFFARFDTNTEKFKEIEGPSVDDIHDSKCATLMIQRGCLHVCITYDDGMTGFKETCIQLWKMIEDGCWNNVVTYRVDPYDIRSLGTLHLMRNGKLLMIDCLDIRGTLYEVDLVKEKHSKKKDKWCNLVSMDISDQVRYTETFVSPNLYIK